MRQAGAPASKVVMGFPANGKTYELEDARNNGMGAPIRGKGDGIVAGSGVLLYYEV